MENIGLYIGAAVVIAGLIWGIVKAIVPLTPTKKDDEFVEKVDPVVKKAIDALSPDKPETP